jgi:dipeptidyl-peptidase-4
MLYATKSFFTGVFVFLSLLSFAQKKELSLKDAVMGQYRTFGPDRLYGFQWIPDGDAYSYNDKSFQTLYTSSVKAKQDEVLLTLQQLNQSLASELSSFWGMEWISKDEFSINDGVHFYTYNKASKKGSILHSFSEEIANPLMHEATKAIAYTVGNNIRITTVLGKELLVTNNADKNIVSGQSIARNEFGIGGGLFWSTDGGILAYYQKDETDVHNYPLLDISATPGEVEFIKYPMAGQLSECPKVGLYNLAKGSTVMIAPRGLKDHYLTNLSFTPDGKFILIAEVNREQDHMWLNVYDAQTGAFVNTILEETSETWVEPEHPAFFPNPKSNNFIWISEKSGFNNLYYYDIDGLLLKQLTNNTFVAKSILTASPDGKSVYFAATGENPLNTMVYQVDLNGVQKLITTTEGVHDFMLSSDGKYFYDAYSNHNTPHKSALYAANGKLSKELVNSPEKLSDYAIGTSEINTLTANDGSTLYGRLIKPSNFDPTKKYPVLVYVYGGPHAQMITNSWLDNANLWMFWMAEQGYLIYTVDGRGSAERGVKFESQIHRQLGTVEIEDQLEGVEFLKSLSYVDSNRLAVHGWSFGGFMTTSLMLREPDVFKVGVAGGPVTDWKYYEIMYGERYMDRPEQNPKGYEQASLLTHAGNLKGDLLLIHGTSDDVVVMQHNLALVQKFVELGIQMDFFPYPMHKHNVIGKDRVHLMENVLQYIIENNQ